MKSRTLQDACGVRRPVRPGAADRSSLVAAPDVPSRSSCGPVPGARGRRHRSLDDILAPHARIRVAAGQGAVRARSHRRRGHHGRVPARPARQVPRHQPLDAGRRETGRGRAIARRGPPAAASRRADRIDRCQPERRPHRGVARCRWALPLGCDPGAPEEPRSRARRRPRRAPRGNHRIAARHPRRAPGLHHRAVRRGHDPGLAALDGAAHRIGLVRLEG